MSGTIFTIVGLIIGVMILAAGIYYLVKAKDDAESKKIYGITIAVGAVIIAALVVKIILEGGI